MTLYLLPADACPYSSAKAPALSAVLLRGTVLRTELGRKDLLTKTDVLRCYFTKLIITYELEALLEAVVERRSQTPHAYW